MAQIQKVTFAIDFPEILTIFTTMTTIINSITLEKNIYSLDPIEGLISQFILDSKMVSKLNDADYRGEIRKKIHKARFGYILGDLWAKTVDNELTRKMEE